jgi:parvulin-like peptidyl-prolyl isomerase
MIRALLALAPLLTSSPLPSAPSVQDPDANLDGSKAVLSIDGEPVSADTYTRWLIDTGGSRFARDFAERWVVLREAERRGVAPEEEQVAERLQRQIDRRIEGAFRGEKEGWLAELERLERSEGGFIRQLMTELEPEVAAWNLAAQDRVPPEDKDARDWELIYGPYGKDLDLLMMNFQVEVETGEGAEAQARNREAAMQAQKNVALAIRQRLLDGEDFGELAAQFCSDRALRESRGVPDKDFRRGGWPHAFIDRLCELEVGELSEPLYARGGWWLVRLEDVTETELEDVAAEISAMLIEKGPEQDEVGRMWDAVSEDVYFELDPQLFAGPQDLEGGEALAMHVEGEPIPRRVYAAWMLWLRGEYQARHFAEDWLVARRAPEAGIVVSDEDARTRAEGRVDFMLKTDPRFRGNRDNWVASLSMRGQTLEDYMREQIFRARMDLMARGLILHEREVTEEMVRDEYDRQFGQDGRWLEVRVLQVRAEPPALEPGAPPEVVEPAMAAAVEAARVEAAGYVKRLRDGEDFASISRQHSDYPQEAAEGGRIPGRFRPDSWPTEIAAGVRTLEVGDVSGPLYDGRGSYFVFELLVDREVTYEQARDDLYAEIRDREPDQGDIAGYRNVLSKNADIQRLPGMWD